MTALYHPTQQFPATSGIYRIICTVNGKFYIGSSINLRKRQNEHLNTLRHNEHHSPTLQRAFNKHGESAFIFEIIELVLIPFLLEREQYWLDKYKPFGKKGYNTAREAGSTLGRIPSLETRARMSASQFGRKHTPDTRAKIGNAHRGRKGKKRSPESRAKQSAARKGRKCSPETCAKMSMAQIGNTKNLGKKATPETRAKLSITSTAHSLILRKTLIFTSPEGVEYISHGVKEFCREHHLHHSHIMDVAKGKAIQHKGWKARFPD